MSNYRFCRLVMTTEDNHNKYYEMQETSDCIQVKYGRVDQSCIEITKPVSQWSSLIKSKVKKGYVDVTEFVAVVKDDKQQANNIVYTQELYDIFLKKMMDYRDGLVSATYTVKATQVTRRQLEQAQIYINDLAKVGEDYDTQYVNDLLLKLYTVIPRYMRKVQDYLLPNITLNKLVEQEQDKLDALSSQVVEDIDKNIEACNDKPVINTIASSLNITIEVIKDCPEDIKYITKQLGNRIKGLFKVEINKHKQKYYKYLEECNKDTTQGYRYLIHGTRCSSVIPIIEQGLKIRPSGNFNFSGKIYGDGNYFSEVTSKSLGYTGYDNDKVLLIYKVFVGNPYVYKGWYRGNDFELTYNELKQRGYDSTFVEAGNGLLNSEIIVYKEEQCYLEYIIWL
jgi:poly [ADP-ribose] polymerase